MNPNARSEPADAPFNPEKLSHDEVREIRRRVAAGEDRGALGKEFGVHRASIGNLVNGRTYGHVPREFSAPPPRYGRPEIDRFMDLVSPEPNSGCWLWLGVVHKRGYPQFHTTSRNQDGGAIARAHRYAYETWVGPIPEGLVIDHKCRVRCCVNPEHLEPVTNTENVQRGARARAIARGVR